jgi:NhaP-type Na+/H+ or K+/H+ antiporter
MINDAVSIILFRVVGPLFDRPKEEDENVGFLLLNIVGQFLLNVVCSFLIGSICGNFCPIFSYVLLVNIQKNEIFI